jgi:hypothetical protein
LVPVAVDEGFEPEEIGADEGRGGRCVFDGCADGAWGWGVVVFVFNVVVEGGVAGVGVSAAANGTGLSWVLFQFNFGLCLFGICFGWLLLWVGVAEGFDDIFKLIESVLRLVLFLLLRVWVVFVGGVCGHVFVLNC